MRTSYEKEAVFPLDRLTFSPQVLLVPWALGAHCTHYGAPLVRDAYDRSGTVRCPRHGACFNIVTGDIEDFPGESWTPFNHSS